MAALRTSLLSELLSIVADAAVEEDAPVILLKGMAMLEGGHVDHGDRSVADLDVLASRSAAARLQTALIDLGLRGSATAERHHLPPLAHPQLGIVEVHTSVPGIRDEKGSRLTAEKLGHLALCSPHPRHGAVSIPEPTFLAAHALVHGLNQHGFSPNTYPFLRTFADLIALGRRQEGGIEGLVSRIPRFLLTSVSEREVGAAVLLCERLRSGEDLDADDDAGALLRHAIAGATSPPYRRLLRVRSVLRALRKGDWRRFVLRLRQRLVTRKRASASRDHSSA